MLQVATHTLTSNSKGSATQIPDCQLFTEIADEYDLVATTKLMQNLSQELEKNILSLCLDPFLPYLFNCNKKTSFITILNPAISIAIKKSGQLKIRSCTE